MIGAIKFIGEIFCTIALVILALIVVGSLHVVGNG